MSSPPSAALVQASASARSHMGKDMGSATERLSASRSRAHDDDRALAEIDRSWSNMSISDSFDREATARQPNDHRLTLGATLGIGPRSCDSVPEPMALGSSSPAAPMPEPAPAFPTAAAPSQPAAIPRTFPLLGQLFGIEHQLSSQNEPSELQTAPRLRGPALLNKHARAHASGGPGSPISPDNAPPRKRTQRPQSLPLARKTAPGPQSSTLRPRSTCAFPPGSNELLAPSRPPFVQTSSGTRVPQGRMPARIVRPDRPSVAQPPCPPSLAPLQMQRSGSLHAPASKSTPRTASPLALPSQRYSPPSAAVTVTAPDAAAPEPAASENEGDEGNEGNMSSELGAFFFNPNSPDNSVELEPSSSLGESLGSAGFALSSSLRPDSGTAASISGRIPLLAPTEPSPSQREVSHSLSSSDSDSFSVGVPPPEIRFRAPSLQNTLAIPPRGPRRAMSDAFSPIQGSPLARREPWNGEARRAASSNSAHPPAFEPPVPERDASSSSGSGSGSGSGLPLGAVSAARRGLLFDTLVPPGGLPSHLVHGSPSFLGALAAMNGDQQTDEVEGGELTTGASMSFTASQSGVSNGSASMTSIRATPGRRRNSWDAITPSSTMDRLASGQALGAIDGSPAGLGPALRLDLPPRTPSADDSSPLIQSRRRMVLGGPAAEAAAASNMQPGLLDGSPRPSPSSGGALGGFGASEREGKVLPSYTVKDDGLVRITPDTMACLLQGQYDDQIAGYTVVDCRFPYEFQGGAVKGAVNLSCPQEVLSHLLTPGEGMHATQPLPARQTSMVTGKKHVLIFHCEFSAKRGPTLARALRAADRDRAKVQDYPACHFPELYILAGGYSAFFHIHPGHCYPQAYVPMDDPRFIQQRDAHMDLFRRNIPGPGLRGKQLRPMPQASEGSDGSPLAPQLRPRRGMHARAASSIAPLASRGAFGLAASMARPGLATVDSPGPDESPLGDSPLGRSPLLLRPRAPQGTDTSPLAPQTHRRSLAFRPLAMPPPAPSAMPVAMPTAMPSAVPSAIGPSMPPSMPPAPAQEPTEISLGGAMPDQFARRSSRGFAHPALETALDLPRSLGTGSGGRSSLRGRSRPPTSVPQASQGGTLSPPFGQRPRRLLRTGTAPSLR